MAQLDDEKLEVSEKKSLGLAGTIAKAFIHSPLTPLLLIASLALGLMGLMLTPRQEDPQISVPIADIYFQFPGASARQVSSLATDPLERMMSEIPGVRHVYSASERGQGMVTVQFKVGEEMGPSLVKLYDKLMSNKDKIPPGVSQPLVKPKGIDDVPAVTLTLWSHTVDDASLRQLSLEVMQRLKEVENTSQSFIVGGRPEEMRVEIKPERLNSFGISIDYLAQTIASANEKRAVGESESGGTNLKVYSGSFLRSAKDVESLIVGVRNGSPVYVRDIAKVTEGPGDAKTVVQYFSGPAAAENAPKSDGAPAVTIAIAKKVGTNGVSVADDILEKVESLKGTLIPDNVQVSVTRNYGETANNKVNELILEMLAATSVVTVLIFFFLGLRPTIVVVVVIPVIVLMTIFAAYMLGFTIDRVSLFALIFSIGILVDDATVVVENTYRRWLQKGSVDTATTIDAVREVGNPTILATMAIIAALLPMGFVSGMMGPYMRPIPVLGSVAMLFSLFAAFIFTPWLVMRIRPSLSSLRKMQDSEHRSAQRLDGIVRRILGPLLDSPRKARIFRIIMWVTLILTCVMFYSQHTVVKMLPLDNKPEFNVVVNMPEGTSLPQTANLIQQMTDKIREFPEVTAVQTYAGTASPFNFNGLVRHYYLRRQSWEGDIQIQLLDKGDRDATSHELAVKARKILTPIAKAAGARIQVVEMPPGPPVLQTMVTEIYGPDAKTRRQVAKDITKIFEKAEGVVDVDNLMRDEYNVWTFEVDQRKAEHRNVSIASLNRQLSMVMGGHKLGDVKQGGELEPRFIILQAPLNVRGKVANLGEMPIMTRAKNMVPLGELGRFVKTASDPIIFHKDLRAVEFVTGEVAGRLAAPVYGMLNVSKLLDDYKTPDGVVLASNFLGFSGNLLGPPETSFKTDFEWTGEWTVTYETFRDMGLAFMAALIMIYMLIVLEFGNFRLPGIIMAPIPLTLIGIIPGHWLLGAEFTATSMIGWIALAGIIVRNSILLVDFSKQAVAEGMDHREAVIQAVRTRTRPILITQLTMIAGSLGIILDPIFQGMAISLLFGALVATALTLIVIPLSCFQAPGAYRAAGDPDSPEPAPTPVASAVVASPRERYATDKKSLLARLGAGLAGAVTIAKIIPVFGYNWFAAMFESSAPAAGKAKNAARDLPYGLWKKFQNRKTPVTQARRELAQMVESSKDPEMMTAQRREPSESKNQSKAEKDTRKVVREAARLEKVKMKKRQKADRKLKAEKKAKAEAKQAAKDARKKAKAKAKAQAKAVEEAHKKETAKTEARKAEKARKKAEARLAAEKAERERQELQAERQRQAAREQRKRLEAENATKLAKLEAALKAEEEKADMQAEAKRVMAAAKSASKKKSKSKTAKSAGSKKVSKSKRKNKTGKKKSKNPQDLKRIKGIGPKVEAALNRLGVTRYKHIAKWTEQDVVQIQRRARMSLRIGAGRENWIYQAKILSKGGETEFSRRVDEGQVPSSQKQDTNRDD
jgi:multidrug efflux pump subunit AcrB/predicted flap endonuclease-1-like 5' DNA nuclease